MSVVCLVWSRLFIVSDILTCKCTSWTFPNSSVKSIIKHEEVWIPTDAGSSVLLLEIDTLIKHSLLLAHWPMVIYPKSLAFKMFWFIPIKIHSFKRLLYYVNSTFHSQCQVTYPRGCWVSETSSSTAKALAMYDMPGLDTVHCWSKVRSRVDCRQANFTSIFFPMSLPV